MMIETLKETMGELPNWLGFINDVPVLIEFKDKEKLLKYILSKRKTDRPYDNSLISEIIKKAREHGFDYPEFKAIEKSLGTLKEAQRCLI